MCFFFRRDFSEVPRPIALKLCHMVRIWLNFIIPLQKFGSAPPKKFGAKNMQNFGQFWTISDFDCEYLQNGSRYPKWENVTNYGSSCCVWWKKYGDLWSTNGLELHASFKPLKCTFWDTISRPLGGCCALKFLQHALEIDETLLAHTPTGAGVPKKF